MISICYSVLGMAVPLCSNGFLVTSIQFKLSIFWKWLGTCCDAAMRLMGPWRGRACSSAASPEHGTRQVSLNSVSHNSLWLGETRVHSWGDSNYFLKLKQRNNKQRAWSVPSAWSSSFSACFFPGNAFRPSPETLLPIAATTRARGAPGVAGRTILGFISTSGTKLVLSLAGSG